VHSPYQPGLFINCRLQRRDHPSGLRDPQSGCPLRRPPQRTLQYVCGGLGRPWRNALLPALPPLRDDSL
jgi:hypothetical protein